jgi:Rrf2 family transcriptional regulator, cysteine metabolism repressor
MKLSTKGRYGLRLLMEIALHQEQGQVYMRDIALQQQISYSYGKNIISYLVAGGILRSARGNNGGLSLNKSPEQISLMEVLQLFEGNMDLVECISNPGACKSFKSCAIRDTWVEMQNAMEKVLKKTTLKDLLESQGKREALLVG